MREMAIMRCSIEQFSEQEAGLLEYFHGCVIITPRILGVNGSGVSNSLSDKTLGSPSYRHSEFGKGTAQKVRSSRYQEVASCPYAPIKGVLGLNTLVFYLLRRWARSFLCLSFHECNPRSDDTEMQLDIVEAETGAV